MMLDMRPRSVRMVEASCSWVASAFSTPPSSVSSVCRSASALLCSNFSFRYALSLAFRSALSSSTW